MNIWKWRQPTRDRALEEVDRIIIERNKMTEAQLATARSTVANAFNELLDELQRYEDELEDAKKDIQRDNEILLMLCRGGS